MQINTNEISYKILDIDSLQQLLVIQDEAFEYIKDLDMLRRNTQESLAVCFEKPSVVIGAYYQQTLIGFGILYCAGNTKENLSIDLGELNFQCANVKLIIVRPQYWGNGLQCVFIEKLQSYAKEIQMNCLCATVSPKNVWSLNNFVKMGYLPVKTTIKYGGLERVLLVKYI